ncbi:hypothetical protein C0Q70_12214 [Pomacea canaliculata]|uniref:Uncharacterized protein n=1 Tax=Pomacea canaliculata TaxID=400727 RepID=A0A2T7P0X7_POMCA|nr:hypothetical protein C0Q70_12214 [Pomacea canaliculata]
MLGDVALNPPKELNSVSGTTVIVGLFFVLRCQRMDTAVAKRYLQTKGRNCEAVEAHLFYRQHQLMVYTLQFTLFSPSVTEIEDGGDDYDGCDHEDGEESAHDAPHVLTRLGRKFGNFVWEEKEISTCVVRPELQCEAASVPAVVGGEDQQQLPAGAPEPWRLATTPASEGVVSAVLWT